ncbi:MAG: hypothetical protein QW531_04630, partial [Thermoplasmata archaeon]
FRSLLMTEIYELYGWDSDIWAWIRQNLKEYGVIDGEGDMVKVYNPKNAVILRNLSLMGKLPKSCKCVYVWKGLDFGSKQLGKPILCSTDRLSVNQKEFVGVWGCDASLYNKSQSNPLSDLVVAYVRRGGKGFEKYSEVV